MKSMIEKIIHKNRNIRNEDIYTTKGRDRFHLAETPPKPYKVGIFVI